MANRSDLPAPPRRSNHSHASAAADLPAAASAAADLPAAASAAADLPAAASAAAATDLPAAASAAADLPAAASPQQTYRPPPRRSRFNNCTRHSRLSSRASRHHQTAANLVCRPATDVSWMLLIRFRTEGSRAGRLKTRGCAE